MPDTPPYRRVHPGLWGEGVSQAGRGTGLALPTSLRAALNRQLLSYCQPRALRPLERARDNSIGQTGDRVHPGPNSY